MAMAPFAVRGTLASSTSTSIIAATAARIITNVVLCNTTSSAKSVTLSFGGVAIFSGASIPANSTITWDGKQYLSSSEAVLGGDGAGSSTTYHISGVTL